MRILLFFLFAISLFSCQSSVPKDVIPPAKMKSVLWDMMQADEVINYYSPTDSTFQTLSKQVDYYQKVFAVHKIKKEDFTKSLTYYENHPAQLKTILDSLQKFGERLQKGDTLKKQDKPEVIDTPRKKLSLPRKLR
jgi:hypothetical protein